MATHEKLSPQARTLHLIAYRTFARHNMLDQLRDKCYFVDYGRLPSREYGLRAANYKGNGVVLLYPVEDTPEFAHDEEHLELTPEHEVMAKLNWVPDLMFARSPWLSMDLHPDTMLDIGENMYGPR